MKLLSTTKINLLPHLDSRKLYSLQKGSGLFVVVEKKEEKGESWIYTLSSWTKRD